MSEQILKNLARHLLKCPFDSQLFHSKPELVSHLSEMHEGQICERHRVPRLEPIGEIDRPPKIFICGVCFGFVVPQAVGRNPLSEIPAHIRQQHRDPSGAPVQTSFSLSTDPNLIDKFMAEEALEEVCACSKGCGVVFGDTAALANHWVQEHCPAPSSTDVQAALDTDPERFSSDLAEAFAETEADALRQEILPTESEDGYIIRHFPNVPRIRSRPGEFIVYIEGRLERFREDEFQQFLECQGLDRDPGPVAGSNWVEGQQQVAKLELRFCNIVDGYIPLVNSIDRILPPPFSQETVEVSWQDDPEVWFPCTISQSKRAVYNIDKRLKRAFYDIPSGTFLYVTRVGQKYYRLGLRRQPHTVPNCKFFVRNQARGWDIEFRDSHVEWETSDDVFRHQLTFDEMEALHAEARSTNLSVRDAVHAVMERYARTAPMYIRDVYDIVFIRRTCSLAAVWAQFRPEHECYVRVAPSRYVFDPTGCFPEIRYVRPASRLPEEPSLPPRSEIQEPLLRAIIQLGGTIVFSTQGRNLEVSLAAEFSLHDAARDFAAPRYNSQGNRKWRNHLQFVKDELVNLGQIDSTVRDIWKVTDAGYRRAGIHRS